MREIKFRIYDPETKKVSVGAEFWKDILPNYNYYKDGMILMQYTGLKDKSGKEIYEGDIVEVYISSEWDEEVPRSETAVVEWDNTKYWCKSIKTSDWHELYDFNWKVIGNIYSNPELLK